MKRMIDNKEFDALKSEVSEVKEVATKVEANPTLEGTESALESLLVGDTKYKVGGGGSQLYQHNIKIKRGYNGGFIYLSIISNNKSALDMTSLHSLLNEKGFTTSDKIKSATGVIRSSSIDYNINGLYYDTSLSTIKYIYVIWSSSDSKMVQLSIAENYDIVVEDNVEEL